MSEKKTTAKSTTEAEAFEIIELAINDFAVLTRAFTVITETLAGVDTEQGESLGEESWGEEPTIESGPLEDDASFAIH